MDWTGRIRTALAGASAAPDDDVIEELAQHARAMYEAARADGCSHTEADARVSAQLERWRLDAASLRHRRGRSPVVEPPPAASPTRFAGLAQDVQYAARLIRRQPRHALLTIVTLALGIGATTTLFSVAYGVLMKPLPWPNAAGVVVLRETRGGNAPRFGTFTNAAWLAWSERATTVDGLAAWSLHGAILTSSGEPERIRITAATASLFPVLGVRSLIGRFFEKKDETSRVIVLSEGLWRQRFAADPGVLGRLLDLDGQPYTIIGVLPAAAAYPDRESRAIVPLAVRPSAGNSLTMFNAIAALRPGATPEQAAAEATARGRFVADTGLTTTAIFGSSGPVEVVAQPLHDALTRDVRRPLVVLLAAVGLLLLTATANVASLQLARATARSREMAIRATLGAGGARVMRQLLVENLLIGLAGGAAGLALTCGLQRSMPSLLPPDFPRARDLGVDPVVVAFAVLVTAGTSLVLGLLPALRVRRVNLVAALSPGGAAPIGTGVRSWPARARMAIMVGQVAIACVLLIGGSLLGRSFATMMSADRGYDPSGVMTALLSMPARAYTPERRFEVITRILERLAAGVTEVAFTSEFPLTPGGSTAAFKLTNDRGEVVSAQASTRLVSSRLFSTLRMRIVAGRGLSEADTASSEPVAVVNNAFARRYLGDSPIGVKLPMGVGHQTGESQASIVGIVDDIRYVTANDSTLPEVYFSYNQLRGKLPVQTVTLLTRGSGDPAVLARVVRSAVRDVDAGLIPEVVMTMEERMVRSLARPRLYAILLGSFAGLASIVAAIGLFGALSYSVSQRARELAVRTALGARRPDILRLVLRQGLGATAAGLALGLLASAWLTRLLSAQLYGIEPHDSATFILVPLSLLAVAALACLAPARRAATLDPLRVLRGL